MEKEELQQKVNDSEGRVNKRKTTIEKLCKKLQVNFGELIAKYDAFAANSKADYMRGSEASAIVCQFVSMKPTVELPRDENFDRLYWENCDFNSKVEQLSDNLTKLFDLERVLKNWKTKLEIEINKDNMPKVEVIWNFLLQWKAMATEWYRRNAKRYFELKRDFENSRRAFEGSDVYATEFNRMREYYKNMSDFRIKDLIIRRWKECYYEAINVFTIDITSFETESTRNPDNPWRLDYKLVGYTIDEERLEKELTKEMKDKYETLINQITSITGEITDASGLSIGGKGDINGTVVGVNGIANVNTFGAGGWNIQCFHFRTKVTRVK